MSITDFPPFFFIVVIHMCVCAGVYVCVCVIMVTWSLFLSFFSGCLKPHYFIGGIYMYILEDTDGVLFVDNPQLHGVRHRSVGIHSCFEQLRLSFPLTSHLM
jgi:hypothetical protein